MKQEDQQEDYFMPAAKIQLAWMYDISEQGNKVGAVSSHHELGRVTFIPMLNMQSTNIETTDPLVEDFEIEMLVSVQCDSEAVFGFTDTVKPGILMPQQRLSGG